MKSPRVGIIGARRSRQGLGPWVARFLKASGAEVACFLATGSETLQAAREELAQKQGIEARGYLDLEEMIRVEAPVALAILSPSETHLAYLGVALGAGLHTLCEKPLVWGERGLAEAAGRIVSGYEKRGLKLWENCPWPYTLPSYGRLFPGVLEEAPERFEMRLSPVSTGKEMLGDAMPHALSLLQALAPSASVAIETIGYSTRQIDAPDLTVSFRYRAGAHVVNTKVRLVQSKRQPREAGYAVNGHWARRTIQMADYAIRFEDGTRKVPVPDPLGLLVADFARDLASEAAVDKLRTRQIVQRMTLLDQLAGAWGGESH